MALRCLQPIQLGVSNIELEDAHEHDTKDIGMLSIISTLKIDTAFDDDEKHEKIAYLKLDDKYKPFGKNLLRHSESLDYIKPYLEYYSHCKPTKSVMDVSSALVSVQKRLDLGETITLSSIPTLLQDTPIIIHRGDAITNPCLMAANCTVTGGMVNQTDMTYPTHLINTRLILPLKLMFLEIRSHNAPAFEEKLIVELASLYLDVKFICSCLYYTVVCCSDIHRTQAVEPLIMKSQDVLLHHNPPNLTSSQKQTIHSKMKQSYGDYTESHANKFIAAIDYANQAILLSFIYSPSAKACAIWKMLFTMKLWKVKGYKYPLSRTNNEYESIHNSGLWESSRILVCKSQTGSNGPWIYPFFAEGKINYDNGGNIQLQCTISYQDMLQNYSSVEKSLFGGTRYEAYPKCQISDGKASVFMTGSESMIDIVKEMKKGDILTGAAVIASYINTQPIAILVDYETSINDSGMWTNNPTSLYSQHLKRHDHYITNSSKLEYAYSLLPAI